MKLIIILFLLGICLANQCQQYQTRFQCEEVRSEEEECCNWHENRLDNDENDPFDDDDGDCVPCTSGSIDSPGVIVGIVIAGLVALFIIGVIVFMICYKRNSWGN